MTLFQQYYSAFGIPKFTVRSSLFSHQFFFAPQLNDPTLAGIFHAAERETIVNECKSFIQSLKPTHRRTILLWFIFNHFRRRFHSVIYSEFFIAYCLLSDVCTTYNWPSEKKSYHIKRMVALNRIHQVLLGLVQSYVSCGSSIFISNPFIPSWDD